MSSFSWPSTTGGSSSNASIGPNGSTAPSSSTEVAGVNPSGNLQPLQTDASGNLLVSLAAEPVSPFNVNISAFGGTAVTLGQKASAASLPVVIASDQTAISITAVSLPLPTGAATSDNQTNASQKTQLVDGSGNVISSTSNALNVQVENFPATQPISGTITANQGTSNATPWNDNIAEYGGVATTLGQKVAASSIPTVLASDQITILATSANQTNGTQLTGLVAGSAIVGKVGIDQTTPGTTNGVQVNAALPAGTNNIGKVTSLAGTPTALTVTNAAITVGTSAVRLTVSGSAPAATRVALVATPDSATASTVTFYIGTSTVTNSGATRGVEIQLGQTFIANNDAGDYWIVASVAAQTVTVMEQA